jgi:hypothetical protein
MKNIISLFILSVILITGCEKDYISAGYPTTYSKYPEDVISHKISNYVNRNPYLNTTLNEYGFCKFSSYQNYKEPPGTGQISKDEAIDLARKFISENPSETGVKNANKIDFPNPSTSTSFSGAVLWYLRSLNQKVDTIEVLNSSIIVHLINGKVNDCWGNWYPEINIPNRFNYDQNRAKESLVGLVVSHYTFAGQEYRKTISRADLNDCTVRLKIYPIEEDDKIKLWVCWQIYITAAEYIFYVDVVTGDIISKEPTIISVNDSHTVQ